jgi:hypothetical protein
MQDVCKEMQIIPQIRAACLKQELWQCTVKKLIKHTYFANFVSAIVQCNMGKERLFLVAALCEGESKSKGNF